MLFYVFYLKVLESGAAVLRIKVTKCCIHADAALEPVLVEMGVFHHGHQFLYGT
jgi:hypothetical protein